MIDLRLWRAVLLGVPVALIVAMFSLQEVPRPLGSDRPPDAFDSGAAASLAGELAESSPEPRPGSDQDAAVADLVESRFTSIASASISEQRFEASFEGEEVELRNLIAALPGQSDRQVALIAHRDIARGEGAGSTLAATAALLEIANGFTGSTHRKTLVFVSTDGGSIGALGARRFISDYSDAGRLDAAVVLSQPAAPGLEPPLVIPWSSGAQSNGSQLTQTAIETVSDQADRSVGDPSPLQDVFRLALPSALGEQGPLIESGLDAVRLSASGELPPEPGTEPATAIDRGTLDRFGRAALALVLALDEGPSPPEHGPDAYIGLAGNLLPGWTLGLLALSLLAPVAAVGMVGLARSAHSPVQALAALGWTTLRAVPFLVTLLFVYVVAFFGLIASPEFPFDPAAESPGRGGAIGIALVLLAFAAAAFLLRPLLPPPASLAELAPAAGLTVAALAGLGVWWVNPYLGLLVAAGLQLWVPAAAGVGRHRLGAAALIAAGMIPLLLLAADLAGRFDAGAGVIWDLLLMFTGGQVSDRAAFLACPLAGAALALIAAAGPAAAPGTPQLKLGALVARGRALEERRASRRQRAVRKRDRRVREKRRRENVEPEPPDEAVPRREDEMGAEPPNEAGAPSPGEGSAEPPSGEEFSEPAPDEGPSEPPADDQPEPARDPRIWSKPLRSILRPWSSLTVPGSPSPTAPIRVSRPPA